jgi:hypothetical protein
MEAGMSDENETSEPEDVAKLRKACESLIEHFDTVQIFATRAEQGELGGTVNVCWGAGNWFARYGQVKLWTIREDESARGEVRKRDDA